MSIFKTYLKVVAGHKVYVVIYLLVMNLFGIMLGISAFGQASPWVSPTVAVIDRDDSALSQGITDFLGTRGQLVQLDDTDRALQDATAQDRISYILVIPSGYGEALMDAAATDSPAPALETVISYQSAEGSLMDLQVKGYFQSAYGFAATVATSQSDAARLAGDAMEEEAGSSTVATVATPVSDGFRFYCDFSTYTLFAAIVVSIIVLMNAINQSTLRRRLLAAPTSNTSRGLQLLGACIVVGLISWAWVCVIGIAIFGQSSLASSPGQVLLMCTSLLAYSAVATALGFFLGQMAVGENAANAIANIGGMLLSFLGGAWVSVDLLPESVKAAAHFVPSYWCTAAIDSASTLADTSISDILPPLSDIGVVCLFAIAIVAISLALGRARMREA